MKTAQARPIGVRAIAAFGILTGLAVLGYLGYAYGTSRGYGTPVYVAGAVALTFGVLPILCGWGLWMGRRWALSLAMLLLGVASFLSLVGIAIGSLTYPRVAMYAGELVLSLVILAYLWRASRKGLLREPHSPS